MVHSQFEIRKAVKTAPQRKRFEYEGATDICIRKEWSSRAYIVSSMRTLSVVLKARAACISSDCSNHVIPLKGCLWMWGLQISCLDRNPEQTRATGEVLNIVSTLVSKLHSSWACDSVSQGIMPIHLIDITLQIYVLPIYREWCCVELHWPRGIFGHSCLVRDLQNHEQSQTVLPWSLEQVGQSWLRLCAAHHVKVIDCINPKKPLNDVQIFRVIPKDDYLMFEYLKVGYYLTQWYRSRCRTCPGVVHNVQEHYYKRIKRFAKKSWY